MNTGSETWTGIDLPFLQSFQVAVVASNFVELLLPWPRPLVSEIERENRALKALDTRWELARSFAALLKRFEKSEDQ
jgi:hypothetical protein